MSEKTISQWLNEFIDKAPYNQMNDRYQFSHIGLREALKRAIFFGISGRDSLNMVDSDQIAALERELRVSKEMNRLARGIIEEKDRMIQVLKPQSEELTRLRAARDTRIDTLEGLLQSQRDRIKALESDPTNEEARFNIERQYEREFTNTSHLMGEIGHLKGMVQLITLQRDRYQTTLEEVNARHLALQEEFNAYKKSHPDHLPDDEAGKEAARRIAAGEWDTYKPPYRGTVVVKDAEDYLRDPLRFEGK